MTPAIRTLAALLLALALGSASAAPRLPSMGDPADEYFSLAQEREVGRQMMREIRQRLPLLDDPEINAYIRDLGQRLATHSDMPEGEFHFFVVDSPAINAFAMPGGYIGINTGLVLTARSESELAGVIAHEIAHVTQRHIARRIAASQQTSVRNYAMILASLILATQAPEAGSAAVMASMAGNIQQQLNFSREHEQEADRVGVRTLANARLDPLGMPNFFDRLLQSSRYHNHPPEWLSTHPLTEGRISDTQSRAQGLRKEEIFESDEFAYMQARAKALGSRNPAEAERFFRATLNDDAQNRVARYGLALTLIERSHYDEARKVLARLIRENGEEAAYLLPLADLEVRAGNVDRGLEHYREAASLYPNSVAVRLKHAQALLEVGRAEQARQLLARDPAASAGNQSRYYWLLAQASSQSGRTADARLAMAEHYYFEGDLQPALNQLQQVIREHPADHHQVARASARAEQLRAEIKQQQ